MRDAANLTTICFSRLIVNLFLIAYFAILELCLAFSLLVSAKPSFASVYEACVRYLARFYSAH